MKQLVLAATGGGLLSAACMALFVGNVSGVAEPAVAEASAGRATFAEYTTAPEDFRAAAKRSMASVVHISTLERRQRTLWDLYSGYGPQVQEGTGSGVIYREDGFIVTNNHVIRGAQRVSVSLNDNRRFNATLVGTYPEADLAVLRIEANGLPATGVANSDEVEVGDWVLAVGNPYNLSSTVTAGIVSARGRDIDIINTRDALESFIQTDAAINPGNSGGALVNTRGQLVGLNTAIYSQSGGYSGYGFAIPSNLVTRIVDEIIATGSFHRVEIGIEVSQLDEGYAAELGLGISQGVVVESVLEGGLAMASGLQPLDVVVAAGGRAVRSIAEFREVVGSRKPGDRVALLVQRDGQQKELSLEL